MGGQGLNNLSTMMLPCILVKVALNYSANLAVVVVTLDELVLSEERGDNDLDEAFMDIDCGTVKSSSQIGELSP